jgi:hypothetical protein
MTTADGGQPVEHVLRLVDAVVDGAGQRADRLEVVERRLRHRVDRVGTDEGVDVERLGVRRVLGGRRRPQRSLDVGAPGGQRLPPGPAERLLEQPVGELPLGDGGLAPQGQRLVGADGLEPAVDLGVDAADEEGGHPVHL